ncbi:hypothetical protein [Limosilactobacillus reuteri]|uniref:hypothetical protein n=1 Tax=Limosilactobacillus reuteri TaxID=1598 RepID=UPI001C0B76A3|nr:hypothetical protein [Limosilactobacillus reuteri]MCC4466418.1 hypothetical protein [Limosilactobacillus reuteri]MCC4474193.1 hypothetical protein [Limosilactobacillus reuteri]QWS05315.1 hypothetical protein I6U32_11920 [Limosilactobacillus reuteri]
MIEHLLVPVIATLVIEVTMYLAIRLVDNGSKNHAKSNAESVVMLSAPIILGIYGIMSLMPW